MLSTTADAPVSDGEWQEFLATQSFGQLIATGRAGDLPLVIPTHYAYDGETTIELHLHRDNPVWGALAEHPHAILAVVAAAVYIPTGWNADPGKDPRWSAPTSYYAAVQAIGKTTVVDDHAELAALLRRQMRRMQPEGGYAPIEPGPTPFGRMLRGIRGLRLEIATVRAKFKFGGNKAPLHRLEIASQLAERGRDADLEARAYLLRRHPALPSSTT